MDLDDTIRSRRSYRALEYAEITDGQVNQLMEATSLAPSCSRNQPWRMVFVREKGMLEEVKAALNKGNAWATRASMIIVVCSRRSDDCTYPDREYFLFDTGMSVAFLLLKATELKLVAHPIAGYDPDKVRSALGIPPEYTVVTLINVGKHSEDRSSLSEKQSAQEDERPTRKPFDETFYQDYWKE